MLTDAETLTTAQIEQVLNQAVKDSDDAMQQLLDAQHANNEAEDIITNCDEALDDNHQEQAKARGYIARKWNDWFGDTR